MEEEKAAQEEDRPQGESTEGQDDAETPAPETTSEAPASASEQTDAVGSHEMTTLDEAERETEAESAALPVETEAELATEDTDEAVEPVYESDEDLDGYAEAVEPDFADDFEEAYEEEAFEYEEFETSDEWEDDSFAALDLPEVTWEEYEESPDDVTAATTYELVEDAAWITPAQVATPAPLPLPTSFGFQEGVRFGCGFTIASCLVMLAVPLFLTIILLSILVLQ